MERNKVIDIKNLPSRPPYLLTAITYLLLDKFHAVDWIKGIVWTLIVIIWIAFLVSSYYEDKVSIDKFLKVSSEPR